MSDVTLDPYVAIAEKKDITPQKKIEGLKGVLKIVKTGMLTTRDKDGNLHSRAMTPAGREFFLFQFAWHLLITSTYA